MPDMERGDTALILRECEKYNLSIQAKAYILATAWWETNETMKPVEEAYWLSDDWRRRNLRYYPWHGRGYVQLTWKTNYERAGKELGVDLITDPTRAMVPTIAVQILVRGMMFGWFTGKSLPDYITATNADYVNARRVVNGTDRAEEIAKIAQEYEGQLLINPTPVDAPIYTPSVPPMMPEPPPKEGGFMTSVYTRMAIYLLLPLASMFPWLAYDEVSGVLMIQVEQAMASVAVAFSVIVGVFSKWATK